jgi:hypothetical protein
MHTVTISFPSLEDAEFFTYLARKSAENHLRLTGGPAGIMQDALTRAAAVVGPGNANPFLVATHVKRLKCQDCGSTHDDVRARACPYAADVDNDPGHIVIICDACCQNRADDI